MALTLFKSAKTVYGPQEEDQTSKVSAPGVQSATKTAWAPPKVAENTAWAPPKVTGDPGTEERFTSTANAYDALKTTGAPKAVWGEAPEQKYSSIFGEGDPYKSDTAKSVLDNIASGVRGQDPQLQALAKQQGLARMMLDRRANAARASTAANVAQSGNLGQAVGQNAMAGVERKIAQDATAQMLAQDQEKQDALAKSVQAWTNLGLNQMNEEQTAKNTKDSALMGLYASLAKESPSASKAALKTLQDKLGIQSPQNADQIDQWASALAALDPTAQLTRAGQLKLLREMQTTTPGKALDPDSREAFDADIADAVSSDKALSSKRLDTWKRQSYPDIGTEAGQDITKKMGLPVYESKEAASVPLSVGERINISGGPAVITGVGSTREVWGNTYVLIEVKDLMSGGKRQVFLKRQSGAAPSEWAGEGSAELTTGSPLQTQPSTQDTVNQTVVDTASGAGGFFRNLF